MELNDDNRIVAINQKAVEEWTWKVLRQVVRQNDLLRKENSFLAAKVDLLENAQKL